MLTGPEAFLGMPGASRLWPCARAHLKKTLCQTCPVGGTADKYRWFQSAESSWWDTLGWAVDLVRCVTSVDWHTLSLMGAVPQGSNPPRRGYVYRLAPEELLFKGMLTGPEAFLEPPDMSRLWPCARTHLKKALCHTCRFGGVRDKYRWFNMLDPVDGAHFGRGISGTDLGGCVKSLDTVVSRGCLARVLESPRIRVTQPRLTFLEL